MNNNQKSFLCDLAKLVDQYNIRFICVEDGLITFGSNDEQLQIGGYDSISNTFRTVRTSVKEYEAKWGD